MLVIPHTAAPLLLSYLVNRSQPVDLVLRLFANDAEPTEWDTIKDYEEATGYQRQTLRGSSWVPDGEGVAHPTVTLKGDGVVFGYYLAAGNVLVGAERFEVPFTVLKGTGVVEIVPRIERR